MLMLFDISMLYMFCLLSGIKISQINKAEGERQSTILKSEAERESQINMATGEANAILAKAKARAESLGLLSKAIGQKVKHLYKLLASLQCL